MNQWEEREQRIKEMEASSVNIKINKHELKWLLLLIAEKSNKLEAIIHRAEKKGEELYEFEYEIQMLLEDLGKKLKEKQ